MASFKKVSPKNWSFRFKYRDKITGKRREIKRQGFQSKPEAVKAYEEIKRTIDFGYDVVKDEKLKEFLYYWLKNYKEGKVAKNTYRLHKRNIENHIVPYYQNILLTDVTYNLHQKFINHLIDKGYSKRTVEIIHGTLYSAMEKAKLQMKIEHNPCKGVSIYTEKEQKKRKNKSENVRFIAYDKIDDFLEAAIVDNYTYYLFFRFLIETGVRKGEALALQWDKVDLDNYRIRIDQTIDYEAKANDELFGDTKTYKSTREIPITRRLAKELKAHKTQQEHHKKRLKSLYHNELNLLFCREDGTPLPKSTLFNAFRRILKKAGLPTLSIHSLRHTHAVLMLESKVEMKYIQEALGHNSIQITSDVYSHVSKKIENDAIQKFEEHTKNIFRGAKMGQNEQGKNLNIEKSIK